MRRSKINWITYKQNFSSEYSTDFILRMGFAWKLESGIYIITPMGNLFFNKLKNIISSKMNEIGYYEILNFPISSKNIWNKRDNILKEAFTMENKVIHPTSEETIFFLLQKNSISSKVFSFSFNFRNEIRPSFGLCRTYSFIMKDAYSCFDTEYFMNLEYEKILNFYSEIFSFFEFDFVQNDKKDECEFLLKTENELKTDIYNGENVIEIAHVFKFKNTFLKPSISFGIGLTRMLQFLSLKNKLNFLIPFKKAICNRKLDMSSSDLVYESLKKSFGEDNVFYDDTKKNLSEKIYDLKMIGFKDSDIMVV